MVKMGGKVKETVAKRKWKVRVKTWMLVLALVVLLPIDATLLRFNHIRMTELRDNVLAVDAKISEHENSEEMATSDAELKEALVALKEFVFSHVVVNVVEENGVQRVTFGTGPFYLEHLYLRDATRALEEAEQNMAGDENPYGNVYGMAGETCRAEAIANGWTWSSPEFINCMLSEIQKYPAADELHDTIMASLPSTELYRHNYASPVWAPTVTGFVILLTLIIIIVIIIRLIIWLVLRLALLFV